MTDFAFQPVPAPPPQSGQLPTALIALAGALVVPVLAVSGLSLPLPSVVYRVAVEVASVAEVVATRIGGDDDAQRRDRGVLDDVTVLTAAEERSGPAERALAAPAGAHDVTAVSTRRAGERATPSTSRESETGAGDARASRTTRATADAGAPASTATPDTSLPTVAQSTQAASARPAPDTTSSPPSTDVEPAPKAEVLPTDDTSETIGKVVATASEPIDSATKTVTAVVTEPIETVTSTVAPVVEEPAGTVATTVTPVRDAVTTVITRPAAPSLPKLP